MITLPYLLFSCKKCGSATFADATRPVRICDKCGYKHDITKVIPIKRFDTLEDALAESAKRSDRFILSKCRKCGKFIIADSTSQIRKCPDPRCRHKNDVRKLRRLASFDSILEAQNSLRYIQVPEDRRDQSPFKRGDGGSIELVPAHLPGEKNEQAADARVAEVTELFLEWYFNDKPRLHRDKSDDLAKTE